jgi:hypothetical protein
LIAILRGTDCVFKTPHVYFANRWFEPDPSGTQVNRITMTQEAAQPVDSRYQGPVGIESVRLRPEEVGDRADGRPTWAGDDECAQELERFPGTPTVNSDRYTVNENFELAERIDCDGRRRCCGSTEAKRLHGDLRAKVIARL